MGDNQDPITLHKYLYANVDPANNVDPSGNFSLGSLTTASNINAILTVTSRVQTGLDLLDFALNPESRELSAKEMGLSILLNYGGGKFAKLFSAKFRKLCNSFDGDTVVHTKDGLKPISELKIGDLVLSYNEDTKENEYREVVHLIQNEQEYDFISIELNDGNVIDSTPSHPFFVDGEWIDAQELERDDLLSFLDDRVSIDDIAVNTRDSKVYNLTVDGTHTYYVGESGVLVHNVGKDDACLSKITNVPGRVRSRINLIGCKTRGRGGVCEEGWDHIVKVHFRGPSNKSQFKISPESLRYLLQSQQVVGAPVQALGKGRFKRQIDLGWEVGNSSAKRGSAGTNWLTVYSDEFGNILTAHPGK
jgi:hypothetical protein